MRIFITTIIINCFEKSSHVYAFWQYMRAECNTGTDTRGSYQCTTWWWYRNVINPKYLFAIFMKKQQEYGGLYIYSKFPDNMYIHIITKIYKLLDSSFLVSLDRIFGYSEIFRFFSLIILEDLKIFWSLDFYLRKY